MNYSNQPFYKSPSFYPNNIPVADTSIQPLQEQSYIENILRLNKGKKISVYQTFPDSNEYKDMVFTGILEQSGKDHIIISNPTNGVWQILLMIYVDYISFDEQINYSLEFNPIN